MIDQSKQKYAPKKKKLNNLAEVITRSVIKYSNRTFFNQQTYASIYHRTRKYNHLFDRHHIGRMDRVCLMADKREDWASIMVSCWLRGGVFVPLIKNNPIINQYIIEKIKPKIILTDGNVDDGRRNNIVTIGGVVNEQQRHVSDPFDRLSESLVSRHDPAMILFTSGSTSSPKGVVLSHGNILSNLSMVQNAYKDTITCHDSSYSILPWHHCYGLVCELLFLIQQGASIQTPSSNTPEKIFKEMSHRSPTLFFTVPKILETIYKKDVKFIPSFIKKKFVFGRKIRMVSVGGALCHPHLLSFMEKEYKLPVYQGYGMTETSPMISICTPTHNRIGSVGKILSGVDLCFDEDDSIHVRGDNCMLGYYQGVSNENEILLHEREEWFPTGDKGRLDKDGFLYINGRLKTEYKLSNGKYVNPTYIESLLTLMPSIDQALVYGEGLQHNQVILYTKDDKKYTAAQIKSFLMGRVDHYEIPDKVFYVDEPFTIQNGLLTQKMEPNRQKILEKYKNEIIYHK